jgi:uncharacterized coiled-coil DUF342 family protein
MNDQAFGMFNFTLIPNDDSGNFISAHHIAGADLDDSQLFESVPRPDPLELENSFKKRFEQLSESIKPLPPRKKELKGWDGLRDKLEKYMKEKLTDFYGHDFITKVESVRSASDGKNESDFEKKLAELVAERSGLLSELSGNVLESKDDILSDDDERDHTPKQLDDVEMRMLKRYQLDLSELRKQTESFETALTDLAKSIASKKKDIDKCNDAFDGIRKWVDKIPEFLRNKTDPISVEEIIMTQIEEYIREHDYKTLLEKYQEETVDFIYLLSSCDNFFVKRRKCTICLVKDFTHCCAPCGHCFCLDCIGKIRRNQCHICRQPVKSKVKLHMP